MASTRWDMIPIYKESLSWMIWLGGRIIQINKDVIDLIRKDAKIAQAWSEIAPEVLVKDCPDLPLLTDIVWLQEISLFWNFLMDVLRIDGIHCPLRICCQPSPE